ncbi:unnamed protein product [Mytilus edulis]|uniref:Uncharacterized protein n=1 Tax=Mytilus edulis TaxID=6550 RepID=A0A8S3RKF2_MYTED|nr:unnamed protein product [Mytilus edulis]
MLRLYVMQSTFHSRVGYSISLDGNLPSTYKSSSQICYTINQLHNDDEFEGSSHDINLQNQQEQNLDPHAISMNDSIRDFIQRSMHKHSSGDSHNFSFSELTQSNETVNSSDVKGKSNKEENLSTDSGVSGYSDNNKRVIDCDKTESYEFNLIQSKGKKRKYSTESNDNGMNNDITVVNGIRREKYECNFCNDNDASKSMLTSNIKTREEAVSDNITKSDHQFDDSQLEDCLFEILITAESEGVIKNINSLDLEIQLTDIANYESGKMSRLDKLLLSS